MYVHLTGRLDVTTNVTMVTGVVTMATQYT